MHWLSIVVVFAACSAPPPPPTSRPVPSSVPAKPEPAFEQVSVATPRTSVAGHAFEVPPGWRIAVRGRATVLRVPETDDQIAIVDIDAETPDTAVVRAARAIGVARAIDGLPLRELDRNGWTQRARYDFVTAATEHRTVRAWTLRAGGTWTVVVLDMDDAVAARLGTQWGRVLASLTAKGYTRPTLAGKRAHALDAARIAALGKLVEDAQRLLDVPGVAVGIIQDGKVVVRAGFGERERGKPAKVDATTRFLVWSASKPLTTLMLAMLVDEHRLTWDTPVRDLLPRFRLGGDDTTTTRLRHLVCACTGMPRHDMEWVYQASQLSADRVIDLLATIQPTTKFGEVFQYSNLMIAAAGFIGGHVAYPQLELGRAYDRAMQTRVFDPLGMRDTTLDPRRARTGNYAVGHEADPDGVLRPVDSRLNDTVAAVRPAGAIWSTVDDLLAYVRLELDDGRRDGRQLVSTASLHARRESQVPINLAAYGLGLFVDTSLGMTIYRHVGDGHGYNADVLWIPEANVGLVLLTNASAGQTLRTAVYRKLLELLFDHEPGSAEQLLDVQVQNTANDRRHYRPMIDRPPPPDVMRRLARRYRNAALGDLAIVTQPDGKVVLDTGDWQAELATYRERDLLQLFTWPITGHTFELRDQPTRALILRDAQQEYVFDEVP